MSVNGHFSNSLSITCGVPQVSVLGPLFFVILYITDLPNISNELTFHYFADDTSSICYSSKNLVDLEVCIDFVNTKLTV